LATNDFIYLDKSDVKTICHKLAIHFLNIKGQPISPFESHNPSLLESSLALPKQTFGGADLYPTFEDKATILLYSLTKNHAFLNGNKRIATMVLLTFLYINGFGLECNRGEIADLCLRISKSEPREKDRILLITKDWIKSHIKHRKFKDQTAQDFLLRLRELYPQMN